MIPLILAADPDPTKMPFYDLLEWAHLDGLITVIAVCLSLIQIGIVVRTLVLAARSVKDQARIMKHLGLEKEADGKDKDKGSQPESDTPQEGKEMPYVRGYAEVTVWVPPGLPSLPEFGRPGQGLPGVPGQGLPPGVGWPGLPDVPGIGGGPVLPGRPELPPFPGLPEIPSFPVYPVVDPDDVGGHPAVVDLNATRKIAVTDGDNTFPAYVVVSQDSEDPRHPSKGLPGSWVTVAYHGTVSWAWSPTLTLPEPPAGGIGGRPPVRPGPGLPEREPKR
jgi:hypothetical protein